MNVSIVIPNYNGEKVLRNNLPEVISSAVYTCNNTDIKVEIIIVDDSSSDSSVQVIKEIQKSNKEINIKLIQNKKNIGFSSTANDGVEAAIYEIVVLLNTDVIPEQDFLVSLVTHFTNEKVFAVGCMDKSVEGDGITLRGRGVGSWHRGFLTHSRGEINRNNTLWASGGSSAFNKNIWDKLGGLYAIYNPFYWEDIDLSYRAQKAGYMVLFDKESIVTHRHDTGVIKASYASSSIKTTAYRNQIIFAWINMTDSELLLNHLFWLPIHILLAIFRVDIWFLIGLGKAIASILSVVRFRLKTQRLAVITDENIIKLITL